jgi:hypothetical protein
MMMTMMMMMMMMVMMMMMMMMLLLLLLCIIKNVVVLSHTRLPMRCSSVASVASVARAAILPSLLYCTRRHRVLQKPRSSIHETTTTTTTTNLKCACDDEDDRATTSDAPTPTAPTPPIVHVRLLFVVLLLMMMLLLWRTDVVVDVHATAFRRDLPDVSANPIASRNTIKTTSNLTIKSNLAGFVGERAHRGECYW